MNSRIVVRRVLLAAAAAAATQGTLAQQASDASAGELNEVLVVSKRQHYRGDVRLEEMPQSSVVLSADMLTDLGITRLDSALELSSGVSRQNDFGGWWDGFAIRGFAGDENVPSGFLVNGFAANRGVGGRRDAATIERIEILKGPNAALFGRGEPGGTVNIVTKKPQFEPLGRMMIAAGRFDTYRVEGDVTGALSERVAARLIGSYEDTGSFRDFTETTRYAITPSVLVQFAPRTSFSYEVEYVHQEAPFDRGVVASPTGELGIVPASRFLGEPENGDTEATAWGHQAQLLHGFNRNWSVLFGIGVRRTSLEGFATDAELVGGRQLFFTDGTHLSRQRRYRNYESTDRSARGEVSGTFQTGPFVHHLVTGADWSEFENDVVQQRFRPPPVAAQLAALPGNAGQWINVFNPTYVGPVALGPFVDSVETQKNWGIYVQDQIDIGERWKLRIGARYDDLDLELFNNLTNQLSSAQSPTQFSPQAGLLFQASEPLALFVSYGTGFRANSAAFAVSAPDPEETTAYEAGARYSSLGGGFNATVAVFRMTKTNILMADPLNPGLSSPIGEAESQGVEIDLAGRIPGVELSVLASYSYVDAELTRASLDPNFGLPLNPGDRLLNIPKDKASLVLSREFKVGGKSAFTLGANVQYVSDRVGEMGVDFVLPSYTLVGLAAAFELDERLTFMVDVKNALDEEYYSSSYHRLWVMPGEPRTYALRVNYSFLPAR